MIAGQVVLRTLNLALGVGAATVLAAVVIASLARDPSWYEREWPDASIHELVETARQKRRVREIDMMHEDI